MFEDQIIFVTRSIDSYESVLDSILPTLVTARRIRTGDVGFTLENDRAVVISEHHRFIRDTRVQVRLYQVVVSV